MIDRIKRFFAENFNSYSTAEPINDLGDCKRVKKWIKRAKKLFKRYAIVASIIAFLITVGGGVALVLLTKGESIFALSPVIGLVLFPFVGALSVFIALGHATMKLYSDDVKKSVLKSGVEGYGIGKNIETTHVEVSHEYGNTYSVSSYTENKGCLFALLAGGGRYLLWVIYCAYAGPFVTVKKIKASQENVKKYEAQIS